MSQPRIIGGSARGRYLETPKSGTRPSPSRLREALFNIVEFRDRGAFLDLFSGSGAIGLEAASRGWQSTCVDLSRGAVSVIERNAKNLKLPVQVVQGDALKFAKTNPEAYDLVFAAPPYPLELPPLFQTILDVNTARAGGLYVFQHPTGLELHLTRHGEPVEPEVRTYGSNTLSFVEVA
jgi:16S rRNA (guanine966-N2)-methyltransferase